MQLDEGAVEDIAKITVQPIEPVYDESQISSPENIITSVSIGETRHFYLVRPNEKYSYMLIFVFSIIK